MFPPNEEHPDHRVTIRDIARELGISYSTVSLALRDDPQISFGRRSEIQAAAKERGYRPNPMASALARQRNDSSSRPIAAGLAWLNCWACPENLRRQKEFDLYWQGAYRAAELFGYRLEEIVVDPRSSFGRLEKILESRGILGILIPPQRGAALATLDGAALNWDKFSVVRIGYSLSCLPMHVVAGNHLNSGCMIFDNLLRLGYRRPGYICRADTTSCAHAGFMMRQLNVEPDIRIPLLILEKDVKRSEVSKWLKKYRPDAIVTDIGEMRHLLTGWGLRIPEDVGMASMSILDGDSDAGLDQNSEHIGRVAVEFLISLIQHHCQGIPKTLREQLINGRWVDGSSLPPRINGVRSLTA